MFPDQTVVRGQVRFAFGGIDNQRVDDLFRRRRKLRMCRKRRTAHADDPRLLNPLLQFFPIRIPPVRIRLKIRSPFVPAVGKNLNGGDSGSVRTGNLDGITDFPAGRGMERNGNESVRLGNELSFFNLIAFPDNQLRRRTDILMHRKRVFLKQRRNPDRLSGGKLLAFALRMNPPRKSFRMNG